MVKEIPLTQGKIALVDDEDYERVMKLKWQAIKEKYSWYAVHGIHGKKNIYMHRFILNAKEDEDVDHINHNGLNNLRNNIRIVTNSQNCMNSRKLEISSLSSYKGVSWHRQAKKWRASIKGTHLGLFINEIDAAHAYDIAAKKLFGEYAKINFD